MMGGMFVDLILIRISKQVLDDDNEDLDNGKDNIFREVDFIWVYFDVSLFCFVIVKKYVFCFYLIRCSSKINCNLIFCIFLFLVLFLVFILGYYKFFVIFFFVSQCQLFWFQGREDWDEMEFVVFYLCFVFSVCLKRCIRERQRKIEYYFFNGVKNINWKYFIIY